MSKFTVEIKRTTEGKPYGVVYKDGAEVWRDRPWGVRDGSAQAEAYAKRTELEKAEKRVVDEHSVRCLFCWNIHVRQPLPYNCPTCGHNFDVLVSPSGDELIDAPAEIEEVVIGVDNGKGGYAAVTLGHKLPDGNIHIDKILRGEEAEEFVRERNYRLGKFLGDGSVKFQEPPQMSSEFAPPADDMVRLTACVEHREEALARMEAELERLTDENKALREKLNHVRLMCQSLDDEAEENPLTKLLKAPAGVRLATKAIRLVLDGEESVTP